jgi:TRAP-type C4-dicarboxylate transport system permease small subunit
MIDFRSRCRVGFDRLLDGCAELARWLLLLQVVTVTLDVLLRSFFGISLSWITAANEWSLLLICFLGVAWLERAEGHTRDDSIIARLGPTGKVFSDRLTMVIGLAVTALLVVYGAKASWKALVENHYDYFKLKEVPIWWVYFFIPFGALLWFVEILRKRGRYQPIQPE